MQVDARLPVSQRRHAHHARALRLPQGAPQACRQLEMPQVIRRELRLVATRIAQQGRGHDAGAVDQHVQGAAGGKKGGGKGVDRLRIEQVERGDRHAGHAIQRRLRLMRVARRHQYTGASAGQHAHRFQPQARRAARDDGLHAGQVAPGQRLGGRGARVKTGMQGSLKGSGIAHGCLGVIDKNPLCAPRSGL